MFITVDELIDRLENYRGMTICAEQPKNPSDPNSSVRRFDVRDMYVEEFNDGKVLVGLYPTEAPE